MARKRSIRSSAFYARIMHWVAALSRRLGLSRVTTRAGITEVATRFGFGFSVLAALGVGILLVAQVWPGGLEVQPWHVNKPLQDLGLENESVSAEFESDLREIWGMTEGSGMDAKVAQASVRPPDFTVPVTNTSLRAIVDNLRYLLGIHQRRVSGTGTIVANRLVLRLSDTDGPDMVIDEALSADPGQQVTRGLRTLAWRALSIDSPFPVAVYLYSEHQPDEAEQVALMLLGKDSRSSFSFLPLNLRRGARTDRINALSLLGHIAQDRGAFEEARARFEQALALDRSNKWTESDLGELDELLGNVDAARAHYEKAGDAAGRAFLEVRQNPAAAVEMLKKVASHVPGDPTVHAALAKALETMGKGEEAEREYVAAVAMAPNAPEFYMEWAAYYLRRYTTGCAPGAGAPTCVSWRTSAQRHLVTAVVLGREWRPAREQHVDALLMMCEKIAEALASQEAAGGKAALLEAQAQLGSVTAYEYAGATADWKKLIDALLRMSAAVGATTGSSPANAASVVHP